MKNAGSINILEMHTNRTEWTPPPVDERAVAARATKELNITGRRSCFFIFRTEPYIDALFIRFDALVRRHFVKRFTFREGYVWDFDDEQFFHTNCVCSAACVCQTREIDDVFTRYSALHPEWHLSRYYVNSLKVLDHIYNCMQQNTVKEMLYKAGLDHFAVHIDDLDEINLVASKPSDIYDGLPIRVLRAMNSKDGAEFLGIRSNRLYIWELYKKYPDLFDTPLNEAHCYYLSFLIRNKLTPAETGRLFREKKKDYDGMWCRSIFALKMSSEKNFLDYLAFIEMFRQEVVCGDPIYRKYADKLRPGCDLKEAKTVAWYLTSMREEYNHRFRVSNRRRAYDWQERTSEYIIRYPQTINDFVREAVYMQNCLLGYVEAVADNDTTVLFMRKADDVNMPFITIEVQKNTLKQAYHRFNKDCTKAEAEWISAWCQRHGISTGRFRFNALVDDLG